MESIFRTLFEKEIIPAVKKGKVIIKEYDDLLQEEVAFSYNIRYDFEVIKETMIPVLTIHDTNQFYGLLEQYTLEVLNRYPKPQNITEEQYMKKILAFAFNNATYGDFLHPEQYLRKRIQFFFYGKQLSQEEPYLLNDFSDRFSLSATVSKQSMMLETPYCFTSYVMIEGNKVQLPNISFGISDNVCYFYAIQEGKEKIEEEQILNWLKQCIGKVPKQGEEYSSYYRNKLRNVTPSFVFTVAIFFKYLLDHGICDIQVVPYLPIRYQAKEEANKIRAQQKGRTEEEKKRIYQELTERQQQIQKNITNKFLRTLERLSVITDMVDLKLYPYDYDDNMYIKLQPFSKCSSSLLEELLSSVAKNHKSL